VTIALISCSLSRSFEYSHGPIPCILRTPVFDPLAALNPGIAIPPCESFDTRGPLVITGGSWLKDPANANISPRCKVASKAIPAAVAVDESSESVDDIELDDEDRLCPLVRKYLSSFFTTGIDGVAVG
jgi:hypothetical protein